MALRSLGFAIAAAAFVSGTAVGAFAWDLWGDTVNTASRMESTGVAGRIQITEAVHERLRDAYEFEQRGPIHVKGKGLLVTYFLLGRREQRRRDLASAEAS